MKTEGSIQNVAKELNELSKKTNARLFLVGGFVRDRIYNSFHAEKIAPDDIDLVCFDEKNKFTNEMMAKGFQKHNLVMQDEPMWTYSGVLDGVEIDFAARKEPFNVEKLRKHLGNFDFSCNAVAVSVEDAARCDYSRVISPDQVNPLGDIKDKKLAIINKKRFGINSGEPIRAIRLAEKLGFSISNDDLTTIIKKLKGINENFDRLGEEEVKKLKEAFKTQAEEKELREKIKKMISKLTDA